MKFFVWTLAVLFIVNEAANRPKGFGMTAELNRKKEGKFDAELANECFEWMREVLKDGGHGDEADKLTTVHVSADVIKPLKDGQILCKLINVIKPGTVKKINTSTMAFKQMENINSFLTGAEKLGCAKRDLFQTVDLYEGQNPAQVINGITALGRKAQTIGYDGPVLGPTESTENRRGFYEDTEAGVAATGESDFSQFATLALLVGVSGFAGYLVGMRAKSKGGAYETLTDEHDIELPTYQSQE